MKPNNTPINYNNIKQTNIKNMLFILKILSLVYAAIPLFQYSSKLYINQAMININSTFFLSIIAFIIMGAVMLMWATLDESRRPSRSFIWIEVCFLFVLLIFSIYYADGNHSRYKCLFIILIVIYTIELGKVVGIILSILSSTLVLLLDVIIPNSILYFESDLAIASLFIVIAWTLGYYVELEHTHIEYLTNIANIDGLTGIYNHRYFHEYLQEHCEQHKNKNKPLSLILIDIDFFKVYNDLFGHRKGDELLKEVVTLVTQSIRTQDIAFRYGGDEFCIALPDTEETEAVRIGELLRVAISSHYFTDMEHLPNKKLTASIGVATLSEEIDTYLSLIDKADSALYRAKYLRKNRVEAYGSIWDSLKDISNPNNEDILKYVKTLISIIDAKDKYTYFHIERVAHYCSLFADYLHLDKETKKLLIYGAYLHDLGKLNISKDILISDKKLTSSEWNELKSHPTESVTIIEKLDVFEEVIPIVKHHHERYDGTGYPNNLIGEQIPSLARLLSVIDSFDAMTNKRPYQKTKTEEEGLLELIACKGTQFDPYYVDEFVEMMRTSMD